MPRTQRQYKQRKPSRSRAAWAFLFLDIAIIISEVGKFDHIIRATS